MQVSLNWTELKPIEQLDFEENYGIYVWGFVYENEFIPYYIGIAFNISISNRLTEHANNLVGGRYCIIHKSDLKTFYNFKNETKENKRGLLYIPNWPSGYSSFLKERNELNEHIDNMVNRMHFSYAVLDNSIATKKEYETIEKACINSIGKDRLWNTRGGASDMVKLKVLGESRVTKHFVNNTH